jgi:antitoxin CptB
MSRETHGPTDGVGETSEVRLRRLRMRSARRGTREMDLILAGFARELERLPPPLLDAYERILSENDQDLYHWMSGQANVPPEHEAIVSRIRDFLDRHRGLAGPET